MGKGQRKTDEDASKLLKTRKLRLHPAKRKPNEDEKTAGLRAKKWRWTIRRWVRAVHLTWNAGVAFMRTRELENKQRMKEIKAEREQKLAALHQKRKVSVEKRDKVYDSKEQKKTERSFHGSLRVEIVKACRQHCVGKNGVLCARLPWLLEVPADVRENAIKDLFKAEKATKALLAKQPGEYFHWKRINFRRWTDYKTNLVIRARDMNRISETKPVKLNKSGKPRKLQESVYTSLFSPAVLHYRLNKRSKVSGRQWPIEKYEHDVRITLNRHGHVNLLMQVSLQLEPPLTPATTDQERSERTVAIDPGVRSFLTVYHGSDGSITDWCPGDASGLFQSLYQLDKLKGKLAKVQNAWKKPENRAQLKRKWQSSRDKRKHKRDQLEAKLKTLSEDKRKQHWLDVVARETEATRNRKERKRDSKQHRVLREKARVLKQKQWTQAKAKAKQTGEKLVRPPAGVQTARLRKSMAPVGPRTRWRLKHAIHRVATKIQNKVREVHRKASKWLLEKYDTIILPAFGSAKMSRREQDGGQKRKLRKRTVRQMLNWCHYAFRQHLLSRAREFPGRKVLVCDEAYTSKTCGSCGELNQKLGGSKEFSCASCGYRADRDANGARNILLRFLMRKHKPGLFK